MNLAADSRCKWMDEREYRGASLTGKLDDIRKGVGGGGEGNVLKLSEMSCWEYISGQALDELS